MLSQPSGPIDPRPTDPPSTPVGQLADWLGRRTTVTTVGDPDVVVRGVTLDSRRVRPGDLYVALPGARVHGIEFAAQAHRAGAVAVLTDTDGAARIDATDLAGLPVIVVAQPRELLGVLSARVYGDPAARLRMIGVTGTQGKTTTTRLAEGALTATGTPSAVVGTVGTRVAGRDVASLLTTPEAPDLHALLAVMVEQGVQVCAMEVSSHALVMGRVDGIVFDVAVFLNLGRDHLDFHRDLDDYFAAKASLFTEERTRLALVNLDDDHGRRLLEQCSVPVHTFALTDPTATWRVEDVVTAERGSSFRVRTPAGDLVAAQVPVPGEFNVSNALAAIAACAEVGLDPGRTARGLALGGGVPGRLERVEAGQEFVVVVDYAHKPDAVAAALAALRPLAAGRLMVVLGAGGDRDPGKRPLMGEVAARGCDVLVVTDDNPRSEDPAEIRAELVAGAVQVPGAEVREIGDRGEAIRWAVRHARAGDVVLIAGKGHETGQEIGEVTHPFDDRSVAREALEEARVR